MQNQICFTIGWFFLKEIELRVFCKCSRHKKCSFDGLRSKESGNFCQSPSSRESKGSEKEKKNGKNESGDQVMWRRKKRKILFVCVDPQKVSCHHCPPKRRFFTTSGSPPFPPKDSRSGFVERLPHSSRSTLDQRASGHTDCCSAPD